MAMIGIYRGLVVESLAIARAPAIDSASEVAEARRGDGRDLEDEKPPASALEGRMAAVESRGVEEPQRAEQEMER